MTRAFDNNSFMHGLHTLPTARSTRADRRGWSAFIPAGESHVSKFRAAQYVK